MTHSPKQAPSTNAPVHDPQWIVAVGFLAGIVFILIVVGLVVAFPQPTRPQFIVFRIVLALGGASFSAGIAGFLLVKFNLGHEVLITAGGSLAVFLILFFFSPAGQLVERPTFKPPPSDKTKFEPPESVRLRHQVRSCELIDLLPKPQMKNVVVRLDLVSSTGRAVPLDLAARLDFLSDGMVVESASSKLPASAIVPPEGRLEVTLDTLVPRTFVETLAAHETRVVLRYDRMHTELDDTNHEYQVSLGILHCDDLSSPTREEDDPESNRRSELPSTKQAEKSENESARRRPPNYECHYQIRSSDLSSPASRSLGARTRSAAKEECERLCAIDTNTDCSLR